MKRVLAISLAIMFILSSLCIVAFAKTYEEIPYEVFNYIASEALQLKTNIDISQYNFKVDKIEQISYVMQHLKYNEPLAYFINYQYNVSYYGNNITGLILSYDINTQEELNSQINYINTEVNKIISLIPNGLSDLETAMFVHDYIALNFEYDLDYNNYDIYSLLRDKKGVCEAYTALFTYIMRNLGYEVSGVSSISINHAWSELKLGDSWYHVDTTYDDPVPDRIGEVRRNFMLVSDSGLEQHSNDYDYHYTCTNTKYDTMSWKSNYRPFAYIDGKVYGIEGNNIVEIDLETGTSSDVYTIVNGFEDYWPANVPGSYWPGCFSGLGYYNNLIIFNKSKTIYTFDPFSLEVNEIYSYEGSDYIYRLFTNGSTLYFYTEDNPNERDFVEYTLDLSSIIDFSLTDLTITKLPTKTEYYVGETIDTTGLEAIATYSNAKTKDVTDYVSLSTNVASYGDTTITVTYTEDEVSVSDTFDIVVDFNYSCGSNVIWTYDSETKTLTLQGKGEMNDYEDLTSRPYDYYADQVENVVIGGGISYIGNNAFANFTNLTTITLPLSVNQIQDSAFEGDTNLEKAYGNIDSYSKTYFENMGIDFEEKDVHTPGDINYDGEVDNKDITTLFMYLLNIDVSFDKTALDVNGDGKINTKDITVLFKYVSGYEITLY